jgi:hypothetical protein
MGTAIPYRVPSMMPPRGLTLRHIAAHLSRLSLLALAFALASCASGSPSTTAPGAVSAFRPGVAPAPVSRPVPRYPQSAPHPRFPRSALTTPLPAKPGEGVALRPVVPAASSEVPGLSLTDAPIDAPGVRRFSRPTGSPHEPHPRSPFHGISKAPRSPVPPGLH